MKRKPRWQKHALQLKAHHTWKAPAGYSVFVADRGAVRLNIPEGWVIVPAEDCIEIYDQPQPKDDCRLAVSYLRLPPLDWSALPMTELITTALTGDHRPILSRSDIHQSSRADLEVAWVEMRFRDPQTQREAYSRLAIARGANLQALITFDFWADDQIRLNPVWEEVLRSVELGRYVDDPTKGDVIH